MDPLTSIGTILTGNEQRDAIHIAVAPCIVALGSLWSGSPCKLVKGSSDVVANCDYDDPECIGIVDPFLKDDISRGDRVWIFLKPNSIKSIRHEWYHPRFDTPIPKPELSKDVDRAVSEVLLRQFATEVDLPYEDLMEGLHSRIQDDEYIQDGGKFEGVGFPDHLWDHYEEVTGEVVPEDVRNGGVFSCSC